MDEQTKRRLLLLAIALTSAPSLLLMNPPAHLTFAALMLYGSAVTGYLGVMLIVWIYILGAKSIFGLVFRDMAAIMKIHRTLGTYGAIAILLHPVLIILSYGESWLYGVVPSLGTEFERHVTLGRIAFALFAVVWISSALLRKRMGYRPWKYLHYLSYICLPFALLHIPGTGSQYLSSVAIKAYFFAIVVVTLLITVIRVRGLFNGDKVPYIIKRHQRIADGADGAYVLEIEATGAPATVRTGQYVYLKLGLVSEDHPFSVAVSKNGGKTMTIIYRTFGRFTAFLSALQAGRTVYISDGYGKFLETFTPDAPTVFMAGGIGITPFVQTLLSQRDNQRAWLFYANRTHSSSILLPQLRQALGERSVMIFNQENALEAHEENGYLNADVIEKYLPAPERYRYYLCGPERMIHTATHALASLGVPSHQITTEAFEY